jgi:DNA processing protein
MGAIDLAALCLLPLSWRRDIAERLRQGWPPPSVLDALCVRTHQPPLDAGQLRQEGAAVLDRAANRGLVAIGWGDAAYPPLLAAIIDPPPILWVAGDPAALCGTAVALVGSRAGSPYALQVAERLAADLCARGIVVVSGLARGVDSAAHRGALGAGGRTLAVLGSGADVVYPSEHRTLAREIAAAGAIVSELAPGTRPQPQFFPMRNRIISGLSHAVVVVEAGDRSGSLITARMALEQGRDVLAVPGNVLHGRNRGGHALLRDGAKIVESADDILEELGSGPGRMPGAPKSGTARELAADPVMAALPAGEPCALDDLATRTGLAVSGLLPRLLELELRGLVQRVGGGRFVRS